MGSLECGRSEMDKVGGTGATTNVLIQKRYSLFDLTRRRKFCWKVCDHMVVVVVAVRHCPLLVPFHEVAVEVAVL